MSVQSKKAFIMWLKANDPFLYEATLKTNELKNLKNGMGLTVDWGGMFNSAIDTIKTAAPEYLKFQQQKKIMKMQMKRAEQGLPPANVADYTPAEKLAPEITPETEAAINRVAVQAVKEGTGNLQKMLPWALLGFGAVFALTRRRGK